jgi:NADP-dependent 3-hydroxy acid dehydrogenase YdfG
MEKFMNVDLKDKTAIVTGGSKGYGYGIAKALKAKGVAVWITSRNEDDLKKAAAELGVNYKRSDITKPGDWDRLINTVVKESGKVDILINNAGGGINKQVLENQSDDDIDMSLALNLTGTIYGCKRIVPIMKKQCSGTIINISSICADQAWPGWSIYGAAKAGLGQFAKCLYLELQDFGIRVTTLTPSWGKTGFLEAMGADDWDSETEAKVTKPQDLGDIVVNICELPAHLEILDLTVLPLVQKISPL